MNDTIERSETHATFVIERTSGPSRRSGTRCRTTTHGPVVQSGIRRQEKSHEFRVGGHGSEEGQWHGGPRQIPLHLHRHRGSAADRVHLRHVGHGGTCPRR